MEDLFVTIVQSKLYWENVDRNLSHFSDIISKIEGYTDLIVLPEMFSTGFSMDTDKLSETMNGKAIDWMKTMSSERNCDIVGSVIISENGNAYNRLIWMKPDGNFFSYDKRHLFRMGDEHIKYTQGNKRTIVELKGWKIFPLICYDLRFPVWSRNSGDYDVLIYIANWPSSRSEVWKTLLKARAIENQSYVIGVNRIGNDAMGLSYSGDSAVIDHKGDVLSNISENEETIETIKISHNELSVFREKFPVALDADKFEII